MNFIPQDNMEDAVLFKLFVHAQQSGENLNIDDIVGLFSIKIGGKRIELALQNLEDRSYARRAGIQGRPASITPVGYKYIESSLIDPGSFIFNYANQGDQWLEMQRLAIGGVPASDRVVLATDNQKSISDITQSLDQIEQLVISDNEIGSELGDDREILQGEVAATKTLINRPRFRLQKVLQLIIPTLKYLAEKFSGASIGEVAKHLIKLLLDLI